MASTGRARLVVVGTLTAVVAAAAPATGQILPIDGGDEGADLSAFILPIEATIVALEGGTSTTTSSESVAITLEADVFFEFDEAALLPDAEQLLDEVADRIAAEGVTELAIRGHTDNVGSDSYNQDLSERRAEAVEAFLARRLDGVRFTTEGFAAREPVAPNETEDGDDFPEGRAQNRRVELRYEP